MKRLLIVVDYQNDFVDGSLGFPGAELLEEPIAAKIEEYRSAADVIAFTFDTQPPFKSIELVGLVSNICVISNAVLAKAACPEVPVIVDAACTASFDDSLNEKALDVLEGLQVQVTNR